MYVSKNMEFWSKPTLNSSEEFITARMYSNFTEVTVAYKQSTTQHYCYKHVIRRYRCWHYYYVQTHAI